MLKPHGYTVCVCDDGRTIEHDAITCGHCNQIVMVKPGTASTVYYIPQMVGPAIEEAGAHCRSCDKPVCLKCCDLGVCTPLMRRIEQMEARGRLRLVGA